MFNTFEEEIELIKNWAMVDTSNIGIYYRDNLQYMSLILLNILKHIYDNFDPSKRNIVIDFNIDHSLKPFMMCGYRTYNPSSKYNNLNAYYNFFNACEDLEKLINSNRFNTFRISVRILNNYFTRKKGLHLCDIEFDINYIKANCNVCGRELIAYYTYPKDYERNTLSAKITDFGFCCKGEQNSMKVLSRANYTDRTRSNFEAFKEFFETKSANRGKFTMIDNYTLICKENNHTFRLGEYISSNKVNEPIKCWICEEHLDEKYKLFSILKRLECNYRIEERDKSTVNLKGVTREQRKLLPLTIYTMDNRGNLTGKIVFDDLFGEQQAKANSNGLVFRWFEMQYLNDFDYCKQFLYDFFKEIAEKKKKRKKL